MYINKDGSIATAYPLYKNKGMIEFIMEYSFECKRDHLGYLRVVLPAELEYFSDFIEDIVSVAEADEYLKMIQDVLDGSSEEYEIQLNTTIAYIKEDQTVIEHLYTENGDRKFQKTHTRLERQDPPKV
ncbi:tRNA-Val4 [Bacillus siamensis]|uniref:tRNA-Val4 n=1 Tax=Bacillus TaxID=1386 RepID=UPI000AAA21AE